MRNYYKDVEELNEDELWELKDRLFWNSEEEYLTEEQMEIINNALDPDDIPNEIVFEVFEGTAFEEEDFWCNIPDR